VVRSPRDDGAGLGEGTTLVYTATQPSRLVPDIDVEEPNVADIVVEDGVLVDDFLTEKLRRLLTEPRYSSWRVYPQTTAADAASRRS
jgi:hypothetical protein